LPVTALPQTTFGIALLPFSPFSLRNTGWLLKAAKPNSPESLQEIIIIRYIHPQNHTHMSPKTRNIIGWILTGLLALLFLWSASTKLIGGAEMEKNTAGLGVSMSVLKILG